MTSDRRGCNVKTSHRCQSDVMCPFGGSEVSFEKSIGRLRKSGGQKIDLISLLLNKFS